MPRLIYGNLCSVEGVREEEEGKGGKKEMYSFFLYMYRLFPLSFREHRGLRNLAFVIVVVFQLYHAIQYHGGTGMVQHCAIISVARISFLKHLKCGNPGSLLSFQVGHLAKEHLHERRAVRDALLSALVSSP